MPTVIAALRLSADDDAIKFLDKHDALSKTDLALVTIEEISVAAGVDTKRLLELAVSALVEDSRSAGAIIAASFHPRVIRATAEAALDDDVYFDARGNPHYVDHHNDRRLFLQGTGFLPQPANRSGGGVFVNITNQNAAAAQAGVPQVGEGESEDQPRFNAAEDDLKQFHETLDGGKLLEAPKVVENPANLVIGHMYQESQEELECIPQPSQK